MTRLFRRLLAVAAIVFVVVAWASAQEKIKGNLTITGLGNGTFTVTRK